MQRRLSLVLVLTLLTLCLPTTVMADDNPQAGLAEAALELVFVELAGRPLADADGLPPGAIGAEHDAFRAQVKGKGLRLRERYVYGTLFNGFSLEIRSADLPAVAALPGVKAVWPVVHYAVPELLTSRDMIAAVETYAELRYDGAGVLVAVIDTGIDYNHPDLGGGYGPGFRVVGGWDLVGDGFDARDPAKRIPVPDPDPMDPRGHGTHVAGIIGANGTIRGVAPGVNFLAYKVFGQQGTTLADVMLAAMERALVDGARVVNMSIGSAFQWPQYPTAQGADRLVNRGVVVVASQGNNGTSGLFGGGAPSVGSKTLAVASFDNTHSLLPVFRLPDGTPVGYVTMTYSPPVFTSGSHAIAHVGLGYRESDYAGVDVAGKVALIQRGAAPFADKVAMAKARGAVGAIIYNNAPGVFSGTLGGPGDWIPAAGISMEDGLRIRAALDAAGVVSITWTDTRLPCPNRTGGMISGFSSWGPSPDLALKPDLSAPGGSIHSTYPLALGGYATLSGTSMSAPHIAGAAALLLQAYPDLRPSAVGAMLLNTATPSLWRPDLGYPHLLPVHRQGAGLANVLAALTAGARVEPAKVSLGPVSGPVAVSLTVESKSATPVTYTFTHAPGLTTDHNVFAPSLSTTYATATLPPPVTLAPGGETLVTVTITPPATAERLFGGYIRLAPNDGGPVLSVPYLGFTGDYQALPSLGTGGTYGFPWLATLQGTAYVKAATLTLDLAAGDLAYVLFNLQRQAAKLRVEVFASATGRNLGRILDIDYMPRNSGPTTFFAAAWDGTGRKGAFVPDGDYYLVLSALRPLGKEDDPAHWDTWTSGTVTVVNSPR